MPDLVAFGVLECDPLLGTRWRKWRRVWLWRQPARKSAALIARRWDHRSADDHRLRIAGSSYVPDLWRTTAFDLAAVLAAMVVARMDRRWQREPRPIAGA